MVARMVRTAVISWVPAILMVPVTITPCALWHTLTTASRSTSRHAYHRVRPIPSYDSSDNALTMTPLPPWRLRMKTYMHLARGAHLQPHGT